MAYNTTGMVHHKGIKNEKDIVDKLNAINDEMLSNFLANISANAEKFITAGGTQTKDDAIIVDKDNNRLFGATIKNHKSGTVDYLNTTKLSDFLGIKISEMINESLKDVISNYKPAYQQAMLAKNTVLSDEIKTKARLEVKAISASAIKSINSDVIKAFFTRISSEEPELLIVNNELENKCYLLKKSDRFDLNDIMTFSAEDKYTLETKNTAIESGSVYKNGKDTGIRLRVVLNNGIGALLGGDPNKKKGNKTSSMTLKAQNDNVGKWFENKKAIVL